MKTETLKRNQIVTLKNDRLPLSGIQFKSGDRMKFLGWYGGVGNLARLSRVGDNQKLMVIPADIGVEPVTAKVVASVLTKLDTGVSDIYSTPHSDESGASREIVIASVLAGKHSGQVTMHVTPAEEREYNRGMAEMAQWG